MPTDLFFKTTHNHGLDVPYLDMRTNEQELRVLKRQVHSLRRELRQWQELVDTIASPPWKRLWFFLQGYRLWRVGRWWGKTKDLK